MRVSKLSWAIVVMSLSLGVCETEAAPILVTSRAALGGSDFVDWSQIGPDFTSANSPYTATSNLSQPVVASLISGQFSRRTNVSGGGWNGCFSLGDAVLFNDGNGKITIDFGADVAKAGANIQADSWGAYVARITAYDSSSNALASLTASGISSSAKDGSATFLGVSDTANSIRKITFEIDSAVSIPNSFSINQLDFGTASAIPEPTTLALTATAGLALVLARYRRVAKRR